MKPGLIRMIIKSLAYYRKDAVYQVIITILLSAIITGSIFTGYSVRSSLKKTSGEKLGNTDVIISSGLRYFDATLADKITDLTGNKSVSVLETDGYCSNFSTGVTALNVKIYGITNDFFTFHSVDSVNIGVGEVAVNSALAGQLGIKTGEEIIVRFKEVDPLPANAPFAPSKSADGSKVLIVSQILSAEQAGNFSPGVSQQIPMTLFMNISDLDPAYGQHPKANRILTDKTNEVNYNEILGRVLSPGDVGLTIRISEKTGEPELISDRIFLDSLFVSDILREIPEGKPVLTYLVNNFKVNERTTPYSFVSALPSELYPGTDTDEIVINRWLADDLDAKAGDTITLSWYDPSFNRYLEETSRDFYIRAIAENDNSYSDPLLMPDFPGISGSTTCSGWDAGVPILMDQIRDKDEAYWNKYKGTPKGFLNYETGKMLWGNNFGTATAIRFPVTMSAEKIHEALTGSLDPGNIGFTFLNARDSAQKGAEEGVDFSSLFLSLSFFMIFSCVILLSLAVTFYFDSRKRQAGIMYALGFRNNFIKKLLFTETLFISLAGAIPGTILGYLVNIIIIKALNSVWIGAVQTASLSADFGFIPLLYGLLIVIILSAVLIYFKSVYFLKDLTRPATGELKKHSPGKNLIALSVCIILSVVLVIAGFIFNEYATRLFFIAGSVLFAVLVLLLRYYYIKEGGKTGDAEKLNENIRRKFYSFHPSHIVTPVIFIAAGIFAVMITGANRMALTDKMLTPPGGTGGYLLWAESAVPVKEDLAGKDGKREFSLNEEELNDMVIIQNKRVSGDDASCLNLNYVASPPLLGVDQSAFIEKGSFSFASHIRNIKDINPWQLLEMNPDRNTIYGIADQTVLQWGLKKKTGDTLIFRAENGQPVNIIIAAGLKSSLFQGYLLISKANLETYYPSVEGSSVFLIDGKPELSEFYMSTLQQRLSTYGFSIMNAGEKLASFFQVTNTYLNVFAFFGAFGMIMGIAGLGFVLLRNYNTRRREFALLSATGYSHRRIRKLILKDQMIVLIWGVLTGTISGLTATIPSLRSGNEMPWLIILTMIISIIITGSIVLNIAVNSIKSSSLISRLRNE